MNHYNFLRSCHAMFKQFVDLEVKNGLVILVNKSNIYDKALPCTNSVLGSCIVYPCSICICYYRGTSRYLGFTYVIDYIFPDEGILLITCIAHKSFQ